MGEYYNVRIVRPCEFVDFICNLMAQAKSILISSGSGCLITFAVTTVCTM